MPKKPDPVAEALESAVTKPDDGPQPPDTDLEDAPALMQDRLKRYVALAKEFSALEIKLEDVKAKRDNLAKLLLEDFAASGTQSINCDGLTVYRRTDHYVTKAKGVETQQICDVLEEIGREDLVSDGYNPQSLKSYVLEQLAQLDELDKKLKEFDDQQIMAPYELVQQRAEVGRILSLTPLLSIGSNLRIVSRK